MTLAELQGRMGRWLASEYTAVLFKEGGVVIGYALYKHEAEWAYLRQFFVTSDRRRSGIGRLAFRWLQTNAWRGCPRIRAEVLANNASGIAFWRAVGFADYALTMELELSSQLNTPYSDF